MDLMLQLKTFDEHTSVETVPPNAYVVYMKLLLLDNRLHWKEWFSVTYERLCFETGISCKKTVMTAINFLEQKEFIAIKRGKNKTANQYKIIPLYGGIFTPKGKQNGNERETKGKQNGNEKETKQLPIIKQDIDKTKTIQNSLSQDEPNGESAPKRESEPEREGEKKIISLFENKIKPLTNKAEKESLLKLLDRYGKERTEKAIEETALNNGRSMRYLEKVLETQKLKDEKGANKTSGSVKRSVKTSKADEDYFRENPW